MATPLDSVGTQLWNAALFLGDFILSNKQMYALAKKNSVLNVIFLFRFQDAIVLELGSGCGFVGIVTSNWARHCFCTGETDTVCILMCANNRHR